MDLSAEIIFHSIDPYSVRCSRLAGDLYEVCMRGRLDDPNWDEDVEVAAEEDLPEHIEIISSMSKVHPFPIHLAARKGKISFACICKLACVLLVAGWAEAPPVWRPQH